MDVELFGTPDQDILFDIFNMYLLNTTVLIICQIILNKLQPLFITATCKIHMTH
jgi:hypothetical protein